MVRDFSQKTVQELYETIRVNVDEEEQWKVFDFVEDFFMEELEIGDYINDINSYHLHMFDKHDVTTKKFDAIVEKAGKVDANYAAQIEGYCSLLGEYGKKFEAVCAMLQPEKLRLSPDKYREKLEGINTGYQNAKDTHEQEQSAYEAELYEIETVWYKKMLDKAEDYLIRSAECIVLGNFTDEVTVLGVGVQIVLGIFDLDLPCDIRDIIADVRNLAKADDIKWDMIAMLALDAIGLVPMIGALKYSDEYVTLFKNADKVSVVARSTDGAGVLAKHADEAGAWLHGVKVFRYSDETAEAVASGEKLLKESGTIYESFADMMSPEDAKRYLDFLENGSREGLTSAELAGVEKADALLVSQKVGYEDVWDLRNAGDVLESGRKSKNPMTGGDWHNYFNENYGADNVTWESASIQDIIDMPSKITDFSPKQISNLASRNGWTVEPLGKGRLAGIPYEQGGGTSMHAPNGSSIYIQYHPGSGHHGVMPYYKISSGKNGIVRYYINGESTIMGKDIEELMQCYDRFVDIVKQISMNANEQIVKLKGTIAADELANDFSEIGMMYAKELLENEWITQEQYTIAKTIDEMLVNMSKRKELWSEEALFNAEEWDECRKKGNLLLKMIE